MQGFKRVAAACREFQASKRGSVVFDQPFKIFKSVRHLVALSSNDRLFFLSFALPQIILCIYDLRVTKLLNLSKTILSQSCLHKMVCLDQTDGSQSQVIFVSVYQLSCAALLVWHTSFTCTRLRGIKS